MEAETVDTTENETAKVNGPTPQRTPSTPLPHNISENSEDSDITHKPTESEAIENAKLEGRARAVNPNDQRPQRNYKGHNRDREYFPYAYLLDTPINSHENKFNKLLDIITDGDPTKVSQKLRSGSCDEALSLLTAQISAKKGLKVFGTEETSAIKK